MEKELFRELEAVVHKIALLNDEDPEQLYNVVEGHLLQELEEE